MSNILPLATPHPPAEDWMPALYNTVLDGSLYWVNNEDNLVVDATPDMADVSGMPISSYIGSYAHDIGAEIIVHPTLEERAIRRERIFKNGGSETTLFHTNLPERGWTAAMVTSTRITHPGTGRHYLLNAAQDITDSNDQLAYLQAPAFQGLLMLIVEKDGTVLAATDAVAKFCNPALERGHELRGQTIDQTRFPGLAQREAEQLALSRATEKPAEAIEWLESADGSIRPYAVARIAFPGGRWMVVLINVPMRPWLQKPPPEMVNAPNFTPKITPEQLEVLVDMEAGLSLDASAERNGWTDKNVSYHRKNIAVALNAPSPRQVLAALAGSELGHLVMLYSKIVHPAGRVVD